MLRRISLAEGAVLLLVATLLGTMLVLMNQQDRAQQLLLERTLQGARTLANFTIAAQEQYTESASTALAVIGESDVTGVVSSMDRLDFPATYSRHLTERFSRAYKGAEFRIYSNDPFPSSTARELDSFALEALAVLEREDRPKEYWQREVSADGTAQVRMAIPITMSAQCLACHNSPAWGLSKQDWKVGDIRGAREVTVFLPELKIQGQTQYYTLWALISVSCAVGLFGVFPAVRREVIHRTHFEDLSHKMGERASKFRTEALTDAQTGLGNRRHFDAALAEHIQNSKTTNTPLGLIILDIDHFKSINDEHGHDVGDLVIARIGDVLAAQVRPGDTAARIGGEEFALIIPDLGLDALYQRAETIRRAVQDLNIPVGEGVINVTISGGISILSENDLADCFTKRADQMLYLAKATGRNLVCPAAEPAHLHNQKTRLSH